MLGSILATLVKLALIPCGVWFVVASRRAARFHVEEGLIPARLEPITRVYYVVVGVFTVMGGVLALFRSQLGL